MVYHKKLDEIIVAKKSLNLGELKDGTLVSVTDIVIELLEKGTLDRYHHTSNYLDDLMYCVTHDQGKYLYHQDNSVIDWNLITANVRVDWYGHMIFYYKYIQRIICHCGINITIQKISNTIQI